ncbi:MAG: hypothetical protein ACREO8_04875 [Luteimonas sp.]
MAFMQPASANLWPFEGVGQFALQMADEKRGVVNTPLLISLTALTA